MTGRTRGRWVVLLLLLAGAVGLTALPTWVRATATAPVTGDVAVTASGSQAAPGVVAAALVLLAAAGAVGLVGRFGRWVVVVVVAGAGALVTSSALAARTGARTTAERVAADRTGVARLVAEPEVAVWPWVAAALGVLVLLAAIGLARASARWAPPSSRHERAGAATAIAPPVDATTRTGTAPEGSTPDAAASDDPAPAAPAAAQPAVPEPDDVRATWDALSRGDDPT